MIGVKSDENSDAWGNSDDARLEFRAGSTGAELRRCITRLLSDAVVDVSLMVDIGVKPVGVDSMEYVRIMRMAGQMLAGVTKPMGVCEAVGVHSRLRASRGSRLSGGFGHWLQRHAEEALVGVTIGVFDGVFEPLRPVASVSLNETMGPMVSCD